ncbi:MAG TPA: CocE/NonD family hydrolase, partial [Candidatus Acidoferrales bacterium]|nr:CocE/NonD family hydrolase [Candidatus Acidoferrales bacterium]
MRRNFMFSICALVIFISVAFSQAPQIDTSIFVSEKNVMVPMRDGIKLATDLYFPARGGVRIEGKFPAIMERTPYDKNGAARGRGALWASRGYVYVSQDTRGRFASEGVWHMMTDDVADGYDTAAWIVKQPWSDGGFGMEGGSYVGGTQHAMALAGAPGLKAIIPVDAVSNAGYFGMRNGGAFELRFMNWIFTIGGPNGSRAARDPATQAVLAEAGKNVRQYLQSLPLRKGTTPIRLAPEYEDWLVYAMGHGENDSFWKQPGLNVVDTVAKYKDVPVYVVGGWYDSWARPTMMTYAALAKNKKGPIKLIMGPWIHGRNSSTGQGQVEFGAESAIRYSDFQARWFDRWLKGTQNGVDNEAPVKIFVMGGGSEAKAGDRHMHGGHWREEKEFPLARTKYTPYYLHADGSLSPSKPKELKSKTSYDFDPRNPVPTIGGNISSGDGIMLQGAWDQKCGEHVWNCKDNLPL